MTNPLPQPTGRFRWVQAAGGRLLPAPALVCEPLLEWAEHLFTTRAWMLGHGRPPSGRDGWDEVADALGVAPEHLSRLRQVHGATVVVAGQARGALPDADVVISNRPDLAVAVQAADCVPLLVVDRRTGAVAAAHAGWRGLAAHVPGETVNALNRVFGSRPEDLLAAIGPAIGQCCYEVGEDVREAMARALGGRDTSNWFTAGLAARVPEETVNALNRVFGSRPEDLLAAIGPAIGQCCYAVGEEVREAMARALGGRDTSNWFTAGEASGKWMFDTWASARAQLEAAGVPASQVFVAGLCTASHPDAFCSYRRDGPPAGRIAAAIRPRRD